MSAGNLGRAVFVLDTDNTPLERGIASAETTVRGFGDRAGRILKAGLAVTFATAPFYATILAANQALNLLQQGVIQFNSTVDQSTDVFTKYRGSVEAATARTAELFQIAKETPFDFEGILRGASVLEALGGQWLANAENIRLFGDAAAATVNVTGSLSSSLERTTFWVARLYSGLQSGAPLGEALLRLQELGLVNDKFRSQIELAISAGANPQQLFDQFLNNLRRFEGLMELQQRNFQTQISTTRDNFLQLSAIAGRPIFDTIVEGLIDLNKEIGATDTRKLAEDLGVRLSAATERFMDVVGSPESLDRIQAVASEMLDMAKAIGEMFASAYRTLEPLLRATAELVELLDKVTGGNAGSAIGLAVGAAAFRRQLTLGRDLLTGGSDLFDRRRDDQGRRLLAGERLEADRRDQRTALDPILRQLGREERELARAQEALATARRRAEEVAAADADRAVRQAETNAQRVAQARITAVERAESQFQAAQKRVGQAELREAEAARTLTVVQDTGKEREAATIQANLQRQTDLLTASVERQTAAWVRHQAAIANVAAAHRALGEAQGRLTAQQNRLAQIDTTIQNRGGLERVKQQADVEEVALRRVERARRDVAQATYDHLTAIDKITSADAQDDAKLKLVQAQDAAARIGTDDNLGLLRERDRLLKEIGQTTTQVSKASEEVARREAASETTRLNQIKTRRAEEARLDREAEKSDERLKDVRIRNLREFDRARQTLERESRAVAQARGQRDLASLGVTVARDVGDSQLAETNRQLQARQALASGAANSTGILANSTRVFTEQTVASARANVVLERETKRVAEANERYNATQGRMNTVIGNGLDRVALFSQALSVLAIAVIGVNSAFDNIVGSSIPEAIADWIQYGDIVTAQIARIRQAIDEDTTGEDLDKQIKEAQERLAGLEQEANRVGANLPSATSAILDPSRFLDGDELRSLEQERNLLAEMIRNKNLLYSDDLLAKIELEKTRIDALIESKKSLLAAEQAALDNAYRRELIEQGYSPGEAREFSAPTGYKPPEKRREEAQALEDERIKQLKDVGLDLPKEIQEQLTVDASFYMTEGRKALAAYFSGFDAEATEYFGTLRNTMESGLKAARPDGKLSVPDLIDLANMDSLLAEASLQIQNTGNVTDELYEKIRRGAGPSADEILGLVDAYEILHARTADVEAATARYKQTQAEVDRVNRLVTASNKQLADEMERARDAAKDRQQADQEVLRGMQRGLEDVQRANRDAQAVLQDDVERISDALEVARAAAAAAAEEDQRRIKEQQDVVTKAQEAAQQHSAAYDAVLDGTTERFLAQQGEVDELTRKIIARYEAEIGAARRLKDATSDRATGLERGQRKELLAFDEAIASARERGDRTEVARLTRLRQQAEARGSRQIALERARAAVAQDDFDARAEAIARDREATEDADAAAVKAEQTKLEVIQRQAEERAASREAELKAMEAELKIAQQALEQRQEADKEHEQKLSDAIAAEQRAAEDRRLEDERALEALEEKHDLIRTANEFLLGVVEKLDTKAKDALDAAKENLDTQQKVVDKLIEQNKQLSEQELAWQRIIQALQQAGLLPNLDPNQFVPSPSRPDQEPELPPGFTQQTPPRLYPDGYPWDRSQPIPPGYRLVSAKDANGDIVSVLMWAGDPATPVTGNAVTPPTMTPPPVATPQPTVPPPPVEPTIPPPPTSDEPVENPLVGPSALRAAGSPPSFEVTRPRPNPGNIIGTFHFPEEGGGMKLQYTHNGPLAGTFYIREEADIGKVARALAREQTEAFQRQVALGQPKREVA